MHKSITYSGFVLFSILVVLLFLTASSYLQLGIAVILYPIVAYFAFKLFPRKGWQSPIVTIEVPREVKSATIERVEVTDIDKRAFLKLIGVAGLSLFVFSLFNKKGQGAFFGNALGSGAVQVKDSAGTIINPAQTHPTDGYRISEIDDANTGYYGFTNKDGAWFIMKEDTETGSFRYTRGDSDFASGWVRREALGYDYFSNTF